jgi:hypothetical protein
LPLFKSGSSPISLMRRRWVKKSDIGASFLYP